MLSQDDYKLYTGVSSGYSDEQWQKLVDLAASRLARLLCLDKLADDCEPLSAEEYDDLKLVAEIYDAKELTAEQYDRCGKTLLVGGGTATIPNDLAMLLANFLCMMLAHRGTDNSVTSKKTRNFSISFGSDAAGTFAKLEQNYGDIVEKYSRCGLGFCVESSAKRCCYGCF